ncbi:chitobiase/beta-hexosaminidase C-terminal domain-containing protein [Bacteroides salyersiae]|uniref:chitobiase/beta-hexosaminidase C-terminal domain-containing protein n=1 Tax=Bacteroides salyersiae TaxID=291644 RepID=UPI001E38288A|nr:chitobiase/beta-hexosaminidase C-terminal domain-containing protein [Bacteroides salyersiae]
MVTTNYNENLPTETLPAPIIEVATSTDGGRYMRITMFCETADAEIHYTLDGTIPTKQSPLYTEEITGNSHSVTIKAITTKDGYLDSPIAEYMYGGSGIINEQTDKKIISRIYLPLSDTPLFSPTEGMNIVITTYEDGQLETHKMIWKP